MTCPSNLIWPDVGSTRPATMRSVVVLPHPEGPRRVTNSPSAMSALTLSTARVDPNCFVTSISWTRVIAFLTRGDESDSDQVRALEIARPEQAEEEQYHDERHELHRGGQRRGRRLESRRSGEVVDPERRGRRVRSGDEEGDQEFIKYDDERQQDAGADPWSQ